MRKFYYDILGFMLAAAVIGIGGIALTVKAGETSLRWEEQGGKYFWYENDVKQGTYDDPKGVIGDGTVRGREIYDPDSNGWYWLDACYDGAKACSKEVWMPYIYQNEKKWKDAEIEMNANNSGDMALQVIRAIKEGSGKWVRYDADGKMIKGWYKVKGADAEIYPKQAGNIYYYDQQTGLMAKGTVNIDGETYRFDKTTGVLIETGSEEDNSQNPFDTRGYLYEGMGVTMYFVTVKNNTGEAVKVFGNATALDAGGSIIGADDMTITIVGPGETSIGYFYFSGVTGVDRVDYSLQYDRKTYFKPVLGKLKVEQSRNARNVTLTVTNQGDLNADFVEAYALFFDADDKLCHYDSTYILDNDDEIKPGAVLSEQLNCDKGYDHVKVFLTGRSNGESTPVSGFLPKPDFSVKEYFYENSPGGASVYYIVMTNNSSEPYRIYGNAVAKNAVGKVIGADSMDISVVGPGETTIGYFFFSGVTSVDKVDYQIMYSKEDYFKPVLYDLSVKKSVNRENVVVTVTNNGQRPAQFLEAYALFFDADGHLISCNETYITDNDDELKPGSTLSKQLDLRYNLSAYDHVEVYLTGRYHE